MTKDKKFKHKWLFDSSLSQCQETGIWSLCYVDGIGMFCSVCQMHDSGHPQTNVKVWNASPNVRYRTETIRQHFIKSKEVQATMHSLAADKEKQKSKSYFVKEDQRKEKVMNSVYHKVFASLYWLCKEQIAVSKAVSLLELTEQLGLKEITEFKTHCPAVIRNMILQLSEVIKEKLIQKIKIAMHMHYLQTKLQTYPTYATF